MTVTTALFHGVGNPLTLETFPIPEPEVGEILVRNVLTTLCGSDLHTVSGRRSCPVPCVLGHEIIGRIEQFGKDTSRFDTNGVPLAIGDRITWTIFACCRDCFFCTNGLPQKCQNLFKYGHESVLTYGGLSGGLSEATLLRAGTMVLRLPDDLPNEIACPANCATATVAGLFRVGGGCVGKSVLVQGAGVLGLTACAMAKVGGAKTVACMDIQEERLLQAKQFGADLTLLASNPDGLHTLHDATDGRGFDLCLELSGSNQAIEFGLEALRIGGTYVLAGTVFPTPPISLHPERIVRRMINLFGVHNYTEVDLQSALNFLHKHHGHFPFASIIGHTFDLSEVNDAFQWAMQSSGKRAAIRFGPDEKY